MPGAIRWAINAASIANVPAPHMGSNNVISFGHPANRKMPAQDFPAGALLLRSFSTRV